MLNLTHIYLYNVCVIGSWLQASNHEFVGALLQHPPRYGMYSTWQRRRDGGYNHSPTIRLRDTYSEHTSQGCEHKPFAFIMDE